MNFELPLNLQFNILHFRLDFQKLLYAVFCFVFRVEYIHMTDSLVALLVLHEFNQDRY